MKVVTPEEMKELDSRAMDEYRISGEILMERAGMSVARAAMTLLGKDCSLREGRNVLSIAGAGHNGADSLVALRDLISRGMHGAAILMERDPSRQSEALKREIGRLESMGVPIFSHDDPAARHRIRHAVLIMDGLFGTGFKGAPTGRFERIIGEINRSGESGVPVVSVDIPSGVDGLTGRVSSIAVKARLTVTFGTPKWGLLVDPGTRYAGSVWVSPIGFPQALLEEEKMFCLTPPEAINRLVKRFPEIHKGQAGHILILGGSPGKTGAVLLSARGALRMGSGLVSVLLSDRLQGLDAGFPEVMGVYYPSSDPAAAIRALLSAMAGKSAVACGPGFEVDDLGRKILECLMQEYAGPLVADAGFFSFFPNRPEELARLRKGPLILTPHPGELARLMGVKTENILENPTHWAQEASNRTSAIVLLKGSRTIVADSSGALYVNTTGTSLMAGPGMGDVLTGMLVSLLGQGQSPFEATCLATYFHGAVANMLTEGGASRGRLSSEIADSLPDLLASWEQSHLSGHPLLDDPYHLWPTGSF